MNLQLIPISEIDGLKKVGQDEILDRLWYEFFYPKESHKPEVKKFILTEYNKLAKEINKAAGFNRVIEITMSTKVAAANLGDESCDLKKPIYVPILEFKGVNGFQHTAISPTPKDRQPKVTVNESDNGRVSTLKPKKSKVEAGPKVVKSDLPGEGNSVIEKIINWHKKGKSKPEIIAMGFNKSTVNRQVGEYIKANPAPAAGKGGKKK